MFAVIAVAGGNQVAHAATQANACKVGDQGLAMGNSGNITVSVVQLLPLSFVNGTGCTHHELLFGSVLPAKVLTTRSCMLTRLTRLVLVYTV